MRLLLPSDIHANPWALAAAGPVDQVLFEGDAVNYGPEPETVIERLHWQNAVDWGQAVVAPTPKGALGRLLWDWTREQLSRAEIAYLWVSRSLCCGREKGGLLSDGARHSFRSPL